MPWIQAKLTAHRRRRYHQEREQLIRDMGGTCVTCGTGDSLEIHHVGEKLYVTNSLSRISRIKYYREDFRAGRIELRCTECHPRGSRTYCRKAVRGVGFPTLRRKVFTTYAKRSRHPLLTDCQSTRNQGLRRYAGVA